MQICTAPKGLERSLPRLRELLVFLNIVSAQVYQFIDFFIGLSNDLVLIGLFQDYHLIDDRFAGFETALISCKQCFCN